MKFFTRKDYHKPKSYDMMVNIVSALVIVNKKQPFVLSLTLDGKSFNALGTYLECRGHQQTVATEETNIIQFPNTK